MLSIHYHLDTGALCRAPVIDDMSQLSEAAGDVTCQKCLILVGAQMLDTLLAVFRQLAKEAAK